MYKDLQCKVLELFYQFGYGIFILVTTVLVNKFVLEVMAVSSLGLATRVICEGVEFGSVISGIVHC